ncbi:MAG TPA: arginine deiminase-related protein [Steroidobacteraceae bacterium]|nr:arginine deiminase-related protein [Steroidobacteraceae bacterium]
MTHEPQSTSHVLMIRPVRFIGNPQTSGSNRFQSVTSHKDDAPVQQAALAEFNALASALRNASVGVIDFEDTLTPHTPDSIFPNNWVSFHAEGTAVLYPMLAENRRAERRMDLLEALSHQHGFRISRVVDLTHYETSGKALEGTGSLVLDRPNRIAYACVSPRTDMDVLGDFAQQLDYELVVFEANDRNGAAIYHTNVLMCVGENFAAICSECIREDERAGVLRSLERTAHEIVHLSLEQMERFAGNMLEVRTSAGEKRLAMSRSAEQSLSAEQRNHLVQLCGPIVSAPIPTIERHGGGSVRCMLAEVHLPSRV